jgi:syntaxin-binding protein 5
MDRQALAPFRIPNLWKEVNPKARLVTIVTIALHPRDVGTLLIGYTDGIAIFSFKQNKALKFMQYELPVGSPGGYADPASAAKIRYPKLVQAVWHPTGTFIATAHDDESIVFWDVKTGKVVHARTLQDVNVNRPGSKAASFGSTPGTFALKAPIFRLAWCAKQNPEDTGLLVAGGAPMNLPERGLKFFDFGVTPVYATSSWQILNDIFEKPKTNYNLPTPPNTDVVDFCIIPRATPHFAGAHDPIAVIALLSSGELVTLSFPSGHPITPTNQLHPSLTFVHPFVNSISLARVDRTRWLGMLEKRAKGPQILKGGVEAQRPMMRFEERNIIQTAHADGTIRIWDAGHGDEIENPDVIQVDLAGALDRAEHVDITKMSISGATGELVVGMRSGEVVIFRWDRNRGDQNPAAVTEELGMINIKSRARPDLKEGLMPLTMFAKRQAPVSVVKISDVGFVAAGFEDGSIVVIDMRGPAVIFEAHLRDLGAPPKRGSIRRPSGNQHQVRSEWPTQMEFGVMNLEVDGL